MALQLTLWVVVSLMFFSQLCEATNKHSVGASTHNQTTPKRPKHQPLKSWSMPMIRVQDHKARQNPGQNKSDTQEWAEMVNQSRARWAYVNHYLNRSVGVKAWELPRLEYVTGRYMVELEMGSPPQDTTFVIDTGSALTWMQVEHCNPCLDAPHYPYPVASQHSFDRWVECAEPLCQELGPRADCNAIARIGDDCKFNMAYTGGTNIRGKVGIDTIHFNNNGYDESKAIHVGMASEIHEADSDFDGIMGLARSPLGLSYQLDSEFDNVFSHCIVNPASGRTSKFTMGAIPSGLNQHLEYTPIQATANWENPFYFVTLIGIAVGREIQPINPAWFGQIPGGGGGLFIDSGAAVTLFPEAAFNIITYSYRRQVPRFPVVAYGPYSFCFDTTGSPRPVLPDLILKFAKNVDLWVSSAEAFVMSGPFMCLAMHYIPHGDMNGLASVIGNIFLQNQYIVYDNTDDTIGIGRWNCLSV